MIFKLQPLLTEIRVRLLMERKNYESPPCKTCMILAVFRCLAAFPVLFCFLFYFSLSFTFFCLFWVCFHCKRRTGDDLTLDDIFEYNTLSRCWKKKSARRWSELLLLLCSEHVLVQDKTNTIWWINGWIWQQSCFCIQPHHSSNWEASYNRQPTFSTL